MSRCNLASISTLNVEVCLLPLRGIYIYIFFLHTVDRICFYIITCMYI